MRKERGSILIVVLPLLLCLLMGVGVSIYYNANSVIDRDYNNYYDDYSYDDWNYTYDDDDYYDDEYDNSNYYDYNYSNYYDWDV